MALKKLTYTEQNVLTSIFKEIMKEEGWSDADLQQTVNGEWTTSLVRYMYSGFLLAYRAGAVDNKALGYVQTKVGEKGEFVCSFSAAPQKDHVPVGKIIS